MADDNAVDYQVPKPNPELKKLDFLVGKWKSQGTYKATPYGPAGVVDGEDTFEWFNEYFLKHSWKQPLGIGVEYIGYEEARGCFYTHYFDSNGPYDEEGSTYEGEMRGNKYVQCGPARITYEPSADGKTIKYTAEMGKTGRRQSLKAPDSDWAEWLEATYTRVD